MKINISPQSIKETKKTGIPWTAMGHSPPASWVINNGGYY